MVVRPLIFALALTASAPAMATTFVAGSVGVGTDATYAASGGPLSDPQSQTVNIAGPGTVQAGASSFVYDFDSGSLVNTVATASGTWASADNGTAHLWWGWNWDASGAQTSSVTNTVLPNWTYSFTASGNGTFNMTGNVVGHGDQFGLGAVDWSVSGGSNNSGSFGGTAFDPTASGSFSVPLVAGQNYTISISQFGNVYSGTGGVLDGHAEGNFTWAINYAAVPELSTWAMMLVGIAAVGFAARRQRAAVRVRYA